MGPKIADFHSVDVIYQNQLYIIQPVMSFSFLVLVVANAIIL